MSSTAYAFLRGLSVPKLLKSERITIIFFPFCIDFVFYDCGAGDEEGPCAVREADDDGGASCFGGGGDTVPWRSEAALGAFRGGDP